MIAIDAQQSLGRGGGGQTANEVDDLMLRRLLLAVLLIWRHRLSAADRRTVGHSRSIPAVSAGSTSITRRSMRPASGAPDFGASTGISLLLVIFRAAGMSQTDTSRVRRAGWKE